MTSPRVGARRALNSEDGPGGFESAAKLERRTDSIDTGLEENPEPVSRSPCQTNAEAGVEPEASTSGLNETSSTIKKSTRHLSLIVKWHGHASQRVHHLHLDQLDSLDKLEGLSRNLVDRAFPDGQLPAHLAGNNEEYYNFTPATEECVSFPPGTLRTEFKLVTTAPDGWEYVVLTRELGGQLDPDRKLLITVIEFESTALVIGHLGVRLSLVAYPLISVKKSFLDDIERQLRDPSCKFKGILS